MLYCHQNHIFIKLNAPSLTAAKQHTRLYCKKSINHWEGDSLKLLVKTIMLLWSVHSIGCPDAIYKKYN